jgi:hypothetical protein
MYQIAVKHTNIFHSDDLQKIPKFEFLVFRTIRSGNTGSQASAEFEMSPLRNTYLRKRFLKDFAWKSFN